MTSPENDLFAKKYFVVHGGNLLIANDKGYLRKLLSQKKSQLSSAPDYIEVETAIDKLTDGSAVCWRQFGRMDLALEANYEMVRRGEMASSQTPFYHQVSVHDHLPTTGMEVIYLLHLPYFLPPHLCPRH